ncbi:hypothetical protein [Dactylosporangium sp. NPDC051484]|uniref:hypothetical protein n=1 Tax=Dactylosporangium sp. NPDC051484 TaxID=3154942 RepID=UPI00344ED3CC
MTTTTQTATPKTARTAATEPSTPPATRRRAAARKATEPKKTQPARARARRPEPARTPDVPAPGPESELVTWQDVPMPHVKVPVVHMRKPDVRATLANVRTGRTVTQPRHLLYYGGVGALAALGVLEWPVALAAAAGVWVATRERRTPATAG